MSGVLVFGEVVKGELNPLSREVSGAGRAVADALKAPLLGGLIGAGARALGRAFACAGLETVYVAEDGPFEPYRAEPILAAADAIIARCKPAVVLFPHTLKTREWVPRLAFRMGAGLVTDCTALAVDGGQVIMTKPVYGGGACGEFVVTSAPRFATLRPRAFEPAAGDGDADIVPVEVAGVDERVTVLDEETDRSSSGPRLKDARIVVAGGRGVGKENWYLIEQAAAALSAAVGASRPVTDYGWVPSSCQVGLTGASVAPDLYLAVGISGAVQRLAGIGGARTVVAINQDRDAPIFERARLGVVGDLMQVLPAFVERVRRIRRLDGGRS